MCEQASNAVTRDIGMNVSMARRELATIQEPNRLSDAHGPPPFSSQHSDVANVVKTGGIHILYSLVVIADGDHDLLKQVVTSRSAVYRKTIDHFRIQSVVMMRHATHCDFLQSKELAKRGDFLCSTFRLVLKS